VTVDRTDPPYGLDERAGYDAWLEYHRATLLLKCDGLDAEQLRTRAVATSLMSLHGLVRHMAEVERNWFRKVIDGEDGLGLGIWWDDEHPDGDFEIGPDDTFEADLAVWQEQVDRARAIAAAHGLDDTGTRANGDVVDLRWVYVHMIEEYARHNGHADLLRELLDGSTGE
jgi:hypothetical protein